VVDEQGKQVGVMPIFAAIQRAKKLRVDLVEVAPSAVPPVCKLINFKKFKYLEVKKEKEEKKGLKGGELKEIRLSPFIAKNDLKFRIKRASEFINAGYKVKIKVKFSGREITKKEFGLKLIDLIVEALKEIAVSETKPKFQGKELFLILTPLKKPKKE